MIAFIVKPGAFSEFGEVCVEGFGKLPPQADSASERPASPAALQRDRPRGRPHAHLPNARVLGGRAGGGPARPAHGREPVPRRTGKEGEWLAWQDNQATPGRAASRRRSRPSASAACRRSSSKHARVPIEIRVKPAKLYRLGFGAGFRSASKTASARSTPLSSGTCTCSPTPRCATSSAACAGCASKNGPRLIFLAPFPAHRRTQRGERNAALRQQPQHAARVARLPRGAHPAAPHGELGSRPRPLRRQVRSRRHRHRPRPLAQLLQESPEHFGRHPLQPLHPTVSVRRSQRTARTPYGRLLIEASSYNLLFLQQTLEWDTRDDTPVRAAARSPGSKFTRRCRPPSGSTSASRPSCGITSRCPTAWSSPPARARLDSTFRHSADDSLTEQLQRLGPRPYRLRGGGPYSVRGVQAGALGQRNGDTRSAFRAARAAGLPASSCVFPWAIASASQPSSTWVT